MSDDGSQQRGDPSQPHEPQPPDGSTAGFDRSGIWWAQTGELRERYRETTHASQISALVQALGGSGVVGIYPDDNDPGHAEYLYRKGVVLALDADAARVHDALSNTFQEAGGALADPNDRRWDGQPLWDKRVEGVAETVAGLSVIRLPATPEFAHTDWLQDLDAKLGRGVAMPDHVLHVAGNAGGCPATEAVPSAGPLEPGINPHPRTSGHGSTVAVVDTGWIDQVAVHDAWLAGVTGVPEPVDMGRYTAHGTFIAGVVRAMAPEADVVVLDTFRAGGAIFESDLAPALERAMATQPDIISLSAGTRSHFGQPLKALQNFHSHWLKGSNTVLVAAAGNDGDQGPFYPATFPWAVSVGALDPDESRAPYSNYGPWVDVFARGTDLVNAYPNGRISYYEPQNQGQPPQEVTAWLASWSGTSFATPLVAGLIAARMTWSGETAPVAARALVTKAKAQRVPGVGPVLRPGDAE